MKKLIISVFAIVMIGTTFGQAATGSTGTLPPEKPTVNNYYSTQKPAYVTVQNNVPVPEVRIAPPNTNITVNVENPPQQPQQAPIILNIMPAPPATSSSDFTGTQILLIILLIAFCILTGILIGYFWRSRRAGGTEEIFITNIPNSVRVISNNVEVIHEFNFSYPEKPEEKKVEEKKD